MTKGTRAHCEDLSVLRKGKRRKGASFGRRNSVWAWEPHVKVQGRKFMLSDLVTPGGVAG